MSVHVLQAYLILVLNDSPLSACTNLFIHSSTEGHLGCFQVLAIMNETVINIHVHVSV